MIVQKCADKALQLNKLGVFLLRSIPTQGVCFEVQVHRCEFTEQAAVGLKFHVGVLDVRCVTTFVRVTLIRDLQGR